MKSESPRILIIVENLPVPFDRRVWMEATTLQQHGYQVSIICPMARGYDNPYEFLEGIHIYRHELPAEQSSAFGYLREYACALWSEWRLARQIRQQRGFDVIQACNPPDLIFLVAAWFKILHGTRFIFDHHDLCPELYESKFNRKGFFHRALLWAERLTFLLADTVICTNESYKQVALTRGSKGSESVFVVRSGPNLSLFHKIPGSCSYRNGREYLVGYLGVMGEFDGVDHLVRAAYELIAQRGHKDIHFCFVGGGPMLQSLKDLAHDLGIEDYVEFTGRIPDAEMIERLSTCDVCVCPDPLNPLNEKSTMNKILEYMALERPIVQYDLLEGRRSAGGASLYAEPNNVKDLAKKIANLLRNPEDRARMGEIGYTRMVDKLEWRHQAPSLLRAYTKTLDGDSNIGRDS